MRRDALAEVLTKLLDVSEYEEQPAFWLSLPYVSVRVGRFRLTERSTGPEFDGVRFFAPRSNESGVVPRDIRLAWRHDSPAEAVESLATAGLWPWEIGDERAPRWWCERCDGTDDLTEECERFPCFSMSHPCLACDDGTNADPPSHAALVAIASLGRPLLLRITHTLAREIAAHAGCPDARVVWRVMEREAIEKHHRTRSEWWARLWEYGGAIDPTMPQAFSTEMDVARPPFWTETRWHSQCAARRAWPALRSLAVGDDSTPQPTGVHLVGLDASRIVLAVEAL